MIQKTQISSLEELIEFLDQSNKEEYRALGKKINIPISDFEPYIHYESEVYTRNCIKRTEAYELLLLCWDEGQITPIHCHNNQECWVHVLKGNLHEIRYRGDAPNLKIEQELDLLKEGMSYMNDDMGYHSLENIAKGKAITLHLYMNPIDECNIYDEANQKFELIEMTYHTFEGELVEA